jgi:hypothetical protein
VSPFSGKGIFTTREPTDLAYVSKAHGDLAPLRRWKLSGVGLILRNHCSEAP